ncbi:MAG TPA: disulfide bond formation protein B [Ramlibacter sp.]
MKQSAAGLPHPATTHATGSDAAWPFVFGAWLIAAVAALGALFLSEVVEVAPCVLCWWQRAFMFPLVFVLATGLFPLDRGVVRYAAPLVAAGWLLALYHMLLTKGVIPASLTPCTQGVPCSEDPVTWFGFVTIPLLSLLSFTAIGAALAAARIRFNP